jgi:hypothetical protein
LTSHQNRSPRGLSSNPTPQEIKALRESMGLTHQAFGRLIYAPESAAVCWEVGRDDPRHKRLHPAFWHLLRLRLAYGASVELVDRWVGLFNGAPELGAIDPPGEVSYDGYSRVRTPFARGGTANLLPIVFPPSKQDEPVVATHVAVLDQGKVLRVFELTAEHKAVGFGA